MKPADAILEAMWDRYDEMPDGDERDRFRNSIWDWEDALDALK